jgi:hypothetical protein
MSAFFWLLTTSAYVRYAQKSVVSGQSTLRSPATEDGWSLSPLPSSIFYLLSLSFFALGLMCKPVLVTLPFVLLLLDCWPLRRFELSTLNSQLFCAW